MKRIAGTILAALVMAGCAAHPNPIVDTKGVDPETYARDWQECEAYTEEVSVASGIAKGTATGAAVGAIAGAISGEADRSAGYGGLYGGTRSGLEADRERQEIFKRCLRGRGYKVLN